MRGVRFDGGPAPVCGIPWPVTVDGKKVGQVTSGIWSPRLKCNVGVSIIDREYWNESQPVEVDCLDGRERAGEVSMLPFSD